MKARDILIYLAIKYSGDWSLIYQAIKNKEKVDLEDVEIVCKKYQNSVITIMDKDYPLKLKNIYHPPFVIFYKGDKSLLNMNIISLVGSRDVN
jgi:DNA processing protein